MKKLLLVLLVSTFAFAFTGCQKEEDPPAPAPVVTATTNPPAEVTTSNWYAKGIGWGSNNILLTITRATSPFTNIAGPSVPLMGPTFLPTVIGEPYSYRIECTALGVDVTGTYTITSTGLSFSETGPQGVISILLGGTNNDEIGINKL